MCAPQYLEITFFNTEVNTQYSNCTSDTILPFGNSGLYHAPVTNAKLLTRGDDVKAAFKLCFNKKGIDYDFNVGDTIGIFPANNENEINKLICLLELEKVADLPYALTVSNGTKKKNVCIPKHIPHTGTIRQTFTYNLDIRSPPKKLFLKTLSQYVSAEEDKEKLLFLCSQPGSKDYLTLLEQRKTLVDLLELFPSCKPPVVRLLEHLPSIKPRPYSISSSPLLSEELWITFSVITCDNGYKGLCSGWLEQIATRYISGQESLGAEQPASSFAEIPFYFRKPTKFSLPKEPTTPIVMVACGTGVAPFIGFLQHRDFQIETTTFGDAVLYFGCRYGDRDFLYKEEIGGFLDRGTLQKLHTAFSREQSEKVYVQHLMQKNGEELVNILNNKGILYVCGEAKNMARDIRAAVMDILKKQGLHSSESVNDFVQNLEKNGQYVEDIWV